MRTPYYWESAIRSFVESYIHSVVSAARAHCLRSSGTFSHGPSTWDELAFATAGMKAHAPNDKGFLLPNEGHHTANKQGTTCKAVEAISIAQHRRYTIWTPHMKLTQSDRAGMLNLNGTLYHTRPVHDTQPSSRMRQSNPSHGSSTARESWPSKASRRL